MSSTRRKTATVRKRRPRPITRDGLSPAAARAEIEAAFRRRGPTIIWLAPAIAAVWMLAGSYYFLLPPSYQSKWTLILPVASNGSTVTLENIGQTTSSPTQPFGDVSLSPKVIYKEIVASAQVLTTAAKSLGLTTREFGKARVKLIDETSLMKFRISARKPKQAQAKARALMLAFEIDKRSTFVRKNLTIYRANLDKVRQRMRDFQIATGFLSIEQFKEAALSIELSQRKLTDERGDWKRLKTLQATLTHRIGLTPRQAAEGVRLASDPAFGRLAKAYGDNTAELDESSLRFGPRH
ncbi:MAG: capsular polysaccharide biosynthesis protein, partial [Hyphomicrobiaceae bacterium]